MSRRKAQAPSMIPGEKTGEEFMAVLLWAQKEGCTCPACRYFRDLADGLVKSHIKEGEPGE